ncbi:MAG TPA: serine/threonine-protein kinase [Labilithrix sp.]
MTDEGRKIQDRYELVARVGEGGMGVVWRARDVRLGRMVAVKLLSADTVGSDVARARLIREARAAAALDHEGIVPVYDAGETDDGGAYLVMQLVRGRSLRAVLASGEDFSLGKRAAAIVAAARALHHAHQAGFMHRDVKPDNIMIRDDGRVVVVDFGVAKPLSSAIVANAETVAGVTAKSLTAQGQLVGTPAYLAPEQARGVEVSAATDQFALAVTAFEALTGKLPWRGDGVVEVVASLLRDDAPPVSSQAQVPPELDPVITRALAKDPKDRWPDIGAFADAFEDAAITLADARPSKRAISTRTPDEPASALAKTLDPQKTPPPEISSTKISGTNVGGAPARTRTWAAAVAIGAIALIGWLAASGKLATGRSAPAASSSAGVAPVKYACPLFEVAITDEAWLGGPAAAYACERMQLAHGGEDARTLVPAELLDVPRELSQSLPLGVLDQPDGRAKTVAAAKTRASRWLDGRLEREGIGFRATVVLRDADAKEIARGDGRGVELFEAVRDAVMPLVRAEPPSAVELATMSRDLDVGSVEDAFALLDVHTSILIEEPISLKDACTAIGSRASITPRVAYLARLLCAKKLRTGRVTDPPPAIDESTPGALLTTAFARALAGGQPALRESAARLEAAAELGKTPEERSRFSAAAAELWYALGDDRGRQRARAAVQASPKAVDWRTSAWHRLAFASEGDVALSGALMAWQSWEPVSQSLRGGHMHFTGTGPTADNIAVHRGWLLSQRGIYEEVYVRELLNGGRIEPARALAETTNDDLSRVDVLAGEAKYAEILRTVPRMLAELPGDDEHAARAFLLAQDGASAAVVLGRPADFVGDVVTKWIASTPPHVIDGVAPFNSLLAACCLAPRPVGKACVQRLKELREAGTLPTIFAGADTVVTGAARFVEDDYAGAAKSWRTLLRAPGWLQDPLRDVMAIAFDRSDALDLAEEVDAPTVALVDTPRTADLAWVRAAHRAEKRGDKARAKKLAEAVVARWRIADEDIPSVRDMKQLLAKLGP